MSGGRAFAWVVVGLMGLTPFNWILLWLVNETSDGSTVTRFVIGTIVLWTLAGVLGLFLVMGPRAAGYTTRIFLRSYWRHLAALVTVLVAGAITIDFMADREENQRIQEAQKQAEIIKAKFGAIKAKADAIEAENKAKADAIEAAKTPEQRQAESDAKVAAEKERLVKVRLAEVEFERVYERQEKERKRLREVAAKAECARTRKDGVSIGMTADMVKCSSWGKPNSVNTTTTVYGVSEQWVYGGRSYLYFKDGILTSIQN